MSLINREDLIAEYDRVHVGEPGGARKLMVDAPEVKLEPQWIPCNERLPYAEYGEGDNVLATCGYRNVEDESIRWIRTLCFNGGNWCYPTGETYLEKVYAWMPLPELYKERLEE